MRVADASYSTCFPLLYSSPLFLSLIPQVLSHFHRRLSHPHPKRISRHRAPGVAEGEGALRNEEGGGEDDTNGYIEGVCGQHEAARGAQEGGTGGVHPSLLEPETSGQLYPCRVHAAPESDESSRGPGPPAGKKTY